MRFTPTARRFYLAPALGLVLVTAMSACSSGSSSSSSSTAPSTSASSAPTASSSVTAGGSSSAVAEITANWNMFFSSSTPNSKRVQLLQNGSQFSSAVSSFASSPLAAAVTSKVDSVSLSSATKAKVKYDLSAAGTTVASGASGTAVLQNGTWKVGDDVFCGLLTEAKSAGLTIPVPSACSSAG
ncbi:MAG: hypothetical protein JWO75_4468 [Actinomycetia bacterium]|nr:hypothetical protein [Actinomycetes bacterium]